MKRGPYKKNSLRCSFINKKTGVNCLRYSYKDSGLCKQHINSTTLDNNEVNDETVKPSSQINEHPLSITLSEPDNINNDVADNNDIEDYINALIDKKLETYKPKTDYQSMIINAGISIISNIIMNSIYNKNQHAAHNEANDKPTDETIRDEQKREFENRIIRNNTQITREQDKTDINESIKEDRCSNTSRPQDNISE